MTETLAIEGLGAKIRFNASGFESDLIALTLSPKARATIDTTHLGTEAAKTKRPGQTQDLGTIEAVFDHDPAAVSLVGRPAEQVLITYPEDLGHEFDPIVLWAFATEQGGERMFPDGRMVTAITLSLSVPDAVAVVPEDPPSPSGPPGGLPLSDFALWLDAADESTITMAGSKVTGWADKSGNGRHAYTFASSLTHPERIAAGAYQAIDFGIYKNGFPESSWRMAITNVAQGRHFFIVLGSQLGGGWPFSSSSDYNWHRGDGNASGGYGDSPLDPWLDPVYSSGFLSGGEFYLNGLSVPTYSGLTGGFDIICQAPSVGAPLIGIDRLFSDRDAYHCGGGRLLEMFIINRSLTVAERENCEGYLAWKYGLQGNLPPGHPYKSSPP